MPHLIKPAVESGAERGKVLVSESMVFYAFRYCMGRKTYSVSDCVDAILEVWDGLSLKIRALIIDEIAAAMRTMQAGMDMDVEQWQRVIDRWRQDDTLGGGK
jgi:hypothetical protein